MNDAQKKGRRLKMPGASGKMDQAAGSGRAPGANPESGPKQDMADGLTPNLQAHIGRHLRAVFDEVAREPIPDRLLQLLKDLDQSGEE